MQISNHCLCILDSVIRIHALFAIIVMYSLGNNFSNRDVCMYGSNRSVSLSFFVDLGVQVN